VGGRGAAGGGGAASDGATDRGCPGVASAQGSSCVPPSPAAAAAAAWWSWTRSSRNSRSTGRPSRTPQGRGGRQRGRTVLRWVRPSARDLTASEWTRTPRPLCQLFSVQAVDGRRKGGCIRLLGWHGSRVRHYRTHPPPSLQSGCQLRGIAIRAFLNDPPGGGERSSLRAGKRLLADPPPNPNPPPLYRGLGWPKPKVTDGKKRGDHTKTLKKNGTCGANHHYFSFSLSAIPHLFCK